MNKNRNKNQKQQENSKSLYKRIKEVDTENKWTGGTNPICGFYNEIGLSSISKDPMKFYNNADKYIERYEKWIKNWKQLKKDCVQDILSKFTKEELQEALNNK